MNVLEGYCAISVGLERKEWIGIVKGNINTGIYRKTSKKALSDAKKLHDKLNKYN